MRHFLRYSSVFMLLFLLAQISVAQKEKEYQTDSKKAIKIFEEALNLYRFVYYDQALEKLDEALAEDSNFIDVYVLKGQLYSDIRKPELAIQNYQKALSINPDFDHRLFYLSASVEADLLDLPQASAHIQTYLGFEDLSKLSRRRGEELKELIDYRMALVQNPVPFDPQNLGPKVNGPYTEHSPSLTADEQVLYFTRRMPAKRKGAGSVSDDEDLYLSNRQPDNTWGTAIDLGNDINTHYREGASCVSPDGKYLFFTSCDRPGGFGSCDLYLAIKSGDKWTKPRNLGQTINSSFWESQPSFSSDGRTLFYVSNKGGKGERDIWMIKIGNDGNWGTPINLSINTKGSDQSPFIHPDGKSFYFASNGHKGLGKHDLFMTTLLDDKGNCSEPINLGYPINSSEDDVSLMVSANGKTAYYASGMDGGFGEWDLYSFDLPEVVRPNKVTYSKGLVYDAETKQPVRAKFELIDIDSERPIVESYSDGENGEFLVCVPLSKDYALNVSAKGYLFFSENFSLKEVKDTNSYAFDVPLTPIKEGASVILKNIFFETNKYNLKPTSKVELDKLISFLQTNATVNIEIGGHTDNVGSKAYNQELSENRAKSVYTYLVEHGIPAERLSFKGYNFEKPVATNDTPEGRAQNRRTEFKVIKK